MGDFKNLINLMERFLNTLEMENKYFTPDIEDLHVGYECETKEYIDSNFYKVIISSELYETDNDGIHLPNCPLYKENMILYRTPYLTIEQIEQEGWKIENSFNFNTFQFDKKIINTKTEERGLKIIKYINSDKIAIKKYEYDEMGGGESIIFAGKIKCINEFRKLIKMLEI